MEKECEELPESHHVCDLRYLLQVLTFLNARDGIVSVAQFRNLSRIVKRASE